jgi:hypothetical protein
MAQSAARTEQLPLGIVALDFDGEALGHRRDFAKKA